LEFIGTLREADTRNIMSYLDHVASKRTNATRNRVAAALGGFYRWMRKTGQHPRHFNPMADIAQLREPSPDDGIIIWEQDEITALLKAADKRRDGIAVWVAIFAGLRRSEIARLKWLDVTPAYLLVGKTKTGEGRQVPLPSVLRARLEKEPHSRTRVVPWPEKDNGWKEGARKMTDIYLPRLLPELNKAHPEKFGWNAFRHTFASRHAQHGHSLDLIAAWMGNSPKVCKKHYARFVPQNKRDDRIDAVDNGWL
jgi:integrase